MRESLTLACQSFNSSRLSSNMFIFHFLHDDFSLSPTLLILHGYRSNGWTCRPCQINFSFCKKKKKKKSSFFFVARWFFFWFCHLLWCFPWACLGLVNLPLFWPRSKMFIRKGRRLAENLSRKLPARRPRLTSDTIQVKNLFQPCSGSSPGAQIRQLPASLSICLKECH